MSEEQEKKLDQLLDAVARKYEVQAPEDLPRLIEEALERKKPRPLYRSWQPAFAVLVVGLSAGIMLNKLRREGLAPETVLPVTVSTPEYIRLEPSPASVMTPASSEAIRKPSPPKSKRVQHGVQEEVETSKRAARRPETVIVVRATFEPEKAAAVPAKADEVGVETRFEEEPGLEIRDGQGAKPYLIGERAEPAPVSGAASESVERKIPVQGPSYDEFMSDSGRYIQAGNLEGALVYWNAAFGLMPSISDPLPRASDLSRCRAWLSLGRPDPVLRFLKELEKRKALSVAAEDIKAWISLLEKGEAQALNKTWEKLLAGKTQP